MTLLVLLALSIGMMGVSRSPIITTFQSDANFLLGPVKTVMNNAADTVSAYLTSLTQLDTLRSDNERLRAENKKLQEQLARMPAIARLNDAWTKVSQGNATLPYQTIVARVVMRDITDIRPKTMVINRGLADGVTVGQVVVDSSGALVGRVFSEPTDKSGTVTDPNSATILLVNDISAVAIGEEADTGAVGTVHGQVGGQLQMSYVNSKDTLTKGQTVVTAGETMEGGDVRSPYPHGLTIGTITEISRDPNLIVQSCLVQPAADLNNLEWVLVISDYQGGFASPNPSASGSASPSGSPGPSSVATKTAPVATPAPTPEPLPTPAPTPTPSSGLVTPPPH
jgi:rod shape-determining protein MreC